MTEYFLYIYFAVLALLILGVILVAYFGLISPKKRNKKKSGYDAEEIRKLLTSIADLRQQLRLHLSISNRQPPQFESPGPKSLEMIEREIDYLLNDVKKIKVSSRANEMSPNTSQSGSKNESPEIRSPHLISDYDFDQDNDRASSGGSPTSADAPQRARSPNDYAHPIDEFVDLYNQAAFDRSLRDRFWSKYQESIPIGNSNAFAQARGETTDLDFRTKDGGDLLAFKVINTLDYLVVPQFDTTVKETTINEGGFGYVFEGTQFDSETTVSQFTVIEPAKFQKNDNEWLRVVAGKLDLRS